MKLFQLTTRVKYHQSRCAKHILQILSEACLCNLKKKKVLFLNSKLSLLSILFLIFKDIKRFLSKHNSQCMLLLKQRNSCLK